MTETIRLGDIVAILSEHYPVWREARAELNELPLTAESWQAQSKDRDAGA